MLSASGSQCAMNEWFDVVNDDDVVVSRARRSDCHGNPALIHRAVHVLLVNGLGDLLLQKRSSKKDIQPGKWDTSVGGHLDSGESYLEAARREMIEELGVADIPLVFLYRSTIRNQIESENIETYLTQYSGEICCNPDEITEVRYWTPAAIEKTLGQGVFTPNFEEEWLMFQSFCCRYLEKETNRSDLSAGELCSDLIKNYGLR